jgi:hypothetical protein
MKSASRTTARNRGPRTEERMTVSEVRSEGRGRMLSAVVDETAAGVELAVGGGPENGATELLSEDSGIATSLEGDPDGGDGNAANNEDEDGDGDGDAEDARVDKERDIAEAGAIEVLVSIDAAVPDGEARLGSANEEGVAELLGGEAGADAVLVGTVEVGDVSPPYIQSGPSGMDGP